MAIIVREAGSLDLINGVKFNADGISEDVTDEVAAQFLAVSGYHLLESEPAAPAEPVAPAEPAAPVEQPAPAELVATPRARGGKKSAAATADSDSSDAVSDPANMPPASEEEVF